MTLLTSAFTWNGVWRAENLEPSCSKHSSMNSDSSPELMNTAAWGVSLLSPTPFCQSILLTPSHSPLLSYLCPINLTLFQCSETLWPGPLQYKLKFSLKCLLCSSGHRLVLWICTGSGEDEWGAETDSGNFMANLEIAWIYWILGENVVLVMVASAFKLFVNCQILSMIFLSMLCCYMLYWPLMVLGKFPMANLSLTFVQFPHKTYRDSQSWQLDFLLLTTHLSILFSVRIVC